MKALSQDPRTGSKQRMPVRYTSRQKPYRMVYVGDPFGIDLQDYRHSYDLTYLAGVYASEG